MAVRQTDSEPSAEESAEESTGESACGSQATESAGNTDDAGAPAAREAARAGNAADVPAAGYAAAVRAEQEYVTLLYDLLDQARERSSRYLAGVRAAAGPAAPTRPGWNVIFPRASTPKGSPSLT